jgi:hypothetical protein
MKHLKLWPIISALFLMINASFSFAYEYDYRDYKVYYSVFNSEFLSQDIAKRYNITRSHNRILLNISVHKKQNDGQLHAVGAEINGSSNDLIHTQFITFRTIKEKDAIYHIGVFKTSGHQRQIFDLNIIPSGSKTPLTLRFNHDVYAKAER